MTPYILDWAVVSHFGMAEISISYENKSTQLKIIKKTQNTIIIAFLKITLFKGKEKKINHGQSTWHFCPPLNTAAIISSVNYLC